MNFYTFFQGKFNPLIFILQTQPLAPGMTSDLDVKTFNADCNDEELEVWALLIIMLNIGLKSNNS